MEEDRKKHGWAWAAIVLVVLLVVYPLSTGPAMTMIGASGCNRTLIRAFQWIYDPLRPVERTLDPWIDFWDIYGVRKPGRAAAA